MKEFRLLPVAERIYVASMDERETYGEKLVIDDKKGIPVPQWVFYVYVVLLVFLSFKDQNLFLVFFGLLFVLLAITNIGERKLSFQSLKITFKRNLPFLIAGAFLIIMGAFVDMKTVDDDQEKSSAIFGAIFFSALGLASVGRLTFLLIKAAAIAKRKRECTESVFAVHYGYDDPENLSELTGYPISMVGDPVYRYYYQDEAYKFPIVEDVPAYHDRSIILEMFVDPNQPERYYDEQLFSRNAERIKLLLKFTAFILVVCAAIVAIVFYLS